MTFLVPFDGSYLAEAALLRAAEYGEALDEDVIALTVVPDDEAYAIDVGWYEDGEDDPFGVPYVAGKLHEGVTDIARRPRSDTSESIGVRRRRSRRGSNRSPRRSDRRSSSSEPTMSARSPNR